jgi:predicted anti-sigma-YlaC factor YlaD
MLRLIPPGDCSRARAAVSSRLDGELSELESVRLDDHLRGCAECSAFALELGAIGSTLRAAPLEQPGFTVFEPRRRRPLVALRTASAAAALVAVAAGSAFVVGGAIGVRGGPGARVATSTIPSDFLNVQADSNEQHLLGMIRDASGRQHLTAGRVIAV